MRPLLCLALFSSTLASAQAVLVDRIVASVDGTPITRATVETRARLQKVAFAAALEDLVTQLLIAKDARAAEVTVTEADLDAALETLKSSNQLDDATFEKALAAQGFSLAQYRVELRSQILRYKWLSLRARETLSATAASTAAARAEAMDREEKRLVADLKKRASIEVRP